MFKKLNKKRGFTLIELIIVIAIIAILAAIAVPAFGQIREKANVSTDIGNARTIYSVVAAEIADEAVILPEENLGAEDVNQGQTYELESINGNAEILDKLLPNISAPKAYQEHEFVVWLDSDGNIEIYVVPNGENAQPGKPTDYLIYPTPEKVAGTDNRYAK